MRQVGVKKFIYLPGIQTNDIVLRTYDQLTETSSIWVEQKVHPRSSGTTCNMNETIEWDDIARNGTRIEENGTLIRWVTDIKGRGNFEQSDSSL
jgi:hypothetical protein